MAQFLLDGTKIIMLVCPYQLISYCSNKMIFIAGTCSLVACMAHAASPIAHLDIYVVLQ